jgi:hypothetical protein
MSQDFKADCCSAAESRPRMLKYQQNINVPVDLCCFGAECRATMHLALGARLGRGDATKVSPVQLPKKETLTQRLGTWTDLAYINHQFSPCHIANL